MAAVAAGPAASQRGVKVMRSLSRPELQPSGHHSEGHERNQCKALEQNLGAISWMWTPSPTRSCFKKFFPDMKLPDAFSEASRRGSSDPPISASIDMLDILHK
ncbi:uncharacterized protein LOC144336347 isoform X1 [Macaca mulatta]